HRHSVHGGQGAEEGEVDHLPHDEQSGDVGAHHFAEFQRRQVKERAVTKHQARAQREEREPERGETGMVVERDANDRIAAHFQQSCRDKKGDGLQRAGGLHHARPLAEARENASRASPVKDRKMAATNKANTRSACQLRYSLSTNEPTLPKRMARIKGATCIRTNSSATAQRAQSLRRNAASHASPRKITARMAVEMNEMLQARYSMVARSE